MEAFEPYDSEIRSLEIRIERLLKKKKTNYQVKELFETRNLLKKWQDARQEALNKK